MMLLILISYDYSIYILLYRHEYGWHIVCVYDQKVDSFVPSWTAADMRVVDSTAAVSDLGNLTTAFNVLNNR